jgi:hypothetical protein
MKYRLLLILFINSLLTLAQNNVTASDVKPYNTSKDKPEYEGYHFPEITHSNKKITEKINTFLQIEYLEHPPGVYKKHPFEKICYDQNEYRPHTSFDAWEKFNTPKNILSLKIEGEGTGAYSEYFEQYRSFDLINGNPILLKNLLLQSKTAELNALLKQKVRTEIEDYLKEIRDSVASPKITAEDRERYGAQDTMYTYCLDDYRESTIDYYEYYFTKDSITFVLGRCSNHAMRALDDLYVFYLPMSYKDLDSYLSPYGKSLFLSKVTPTINPETPDGRMFKGTIGTIPVTFIIYEVIGNDGSFSAQYWYDRHKIPIDLSSFYQKGHFSFKEYGESDSPTAIIEADWVNNHKIIGTWKDTKTGRVLKLALEAY